MPSGGSGGRLRWSPSAGMVSNLTVNKAAKERKGGGVLGLGGVQKEDTICKTIQVILTCGKNLMAGSGS